MTKMNLPNLMRDAVIELQPALTFMGNEYEMEWAETSVANAEKRYLKITTHPTKFTLVNFREVRMDQARAYYRQYLGSSGGTVSRTITPVNMRGDSPVSSGMTAQVVTTPVLGTAFSSIPLWGSEGVGNRPQAGGLSTTGQFRVIPPNTIILLEFENQSTNAAAWYAYFKFYEISANAMLELEEI